MTDIDLSESIHLKWGIPASDRVKICNSTIMIQLCIYKYVRLHIHYNLLESLAGPDPT